MRLYVFVNLAWVFRRMAWQWQVETMMIRGGAWGRGGVIRKGLSVNGRCY